MKKNTMMRMASLVLVLVLLTTCCISATFAKYTTQDSAADAARVAKWGIALQLDGHLFGNTYNKGSVTNANVATLGTTDISVHAADAADVVAPGTKNEDGLHLSLNGTPEVASKLSATIVTENIYLNAGTYVQMIGRTIDNEDDFVADTYYEQSGANYVLATKWAKGTTYYTAEDFVEVPQNYYPVVYLMKGTNEGAYADGDFGSDSLLGIGREIATYLNGDTAVTGTTTDAVTTYTVTDKEYPVHHPYSSLKLSNEYLTWAWAFENGGTAAGNSASWQDKADTILALLMDDATKANVVKLDGTSYVPVADVTDYHLKTSFSIDITVTQVD